VQEADSVAAEVEVSETVRFIDNAVGATLDLPTSDNPVARVDGTEDLSLGRFLARPTLIDTLTWSTSDISGIKTTFDPWTAFLSSPAIAKKIDNYAFLRGNLHVKFLVNGTPFQYGSMRFCYSPLGSESKYRFNTTSSLTDLITYSQFPGVFISPQANAGGEMTLPFFWTKNWLDITSATTVARMGKFTSVIFAPLQLAVSGSTTSVTVRTYAWMTDVQLMGSTIQLSLQGDEYGQGPISLPASAIAAAANVLSNVPIIGRFARATEMGAGAISKMASLFGYTNVPVIADVHTYVPQNAPQLASTQIGQPIQKLTVDPKQELSIDSSFNSLGPADELSLSYLKKKESYFGSSSWSTSDTVGTQIFNCRINPQLDSNITLLNSSSTPVGVRSYQVPLSYFGRLFEYWRGDIKIRVKVICTKYHKGRLKISYDPVFDISGSDPDENVVYTQILDIGEHDDVTFNIPYHQPEGWRRVDRDVGTNWSPGNTLGARSGFDNGILTFRVLNTLTAPSTSSVNLLFFVSAGDNFEFAGPAPSLQNTSSNKGYPTFFDLQGEDMTDVTSTEMTIGTTAAVLPERYAVNMGECVASLRTLLHRQCLMSTKTVGDTLSGPNALYTFYKRMPPSPGYDPSGGLNGSNVIAASGVSPFNAINMTPLNWVANAFCGYRGSVNYTLTPCANSSVSLDRVNVYRSEFTNSASDLAIIKGQALGSGTAAVKTSSYNYWNLVRTTGFDGNGGAAITTTRTNGSIMVNFPNYNGNNFAIMDVANLWLGSTFDDTRYETIGLEMFIDAGTDTTVTSFSLSAYAGAGPDFNPVFFLCCPTVDYVHVAVNTS
jgi:hypothetical protein